MEDTTGPFRNNFVPAGWLMLIIFGLIAFTVDTDIAAGILFLGLLPIPFKAIKSDFTILSDFWRTSAPQSNSFDKKRQDALSLLRARYARGDLTEEEFEQKLERLLETETIEQVEKEFESDSE